MNTRIRLSCTFLSLVSLFCLGSTLCGQQLSTQWTREDAIKQLRLHPRDPYLQFVLMQLSKTAEDAAEARRYLPAAANQRQQWAQRNQQIDLYSIFSGSLAVQESLQLDALTRTDAVDDAEKSIAVDSLAGPSVQSHPWDELLAGRSPKVSKLAACIPDDHLFIRFQSVSKLMQMRQLFDETYFYALGNMRGHFRSAGVMDRMQRQWLIEINDLLMPLYDAAVGELAITSSDLFFREGTDATLIMRLNQPQLIRSQLDLMLTNAANNHLQVTIEEGSFGDIPFKHVTTPDRSIHVYVANPTDDLHVRSNSKVAFERILETISGKSGVTGGKSLAETDEFRYIRSLMPIGAEEEDGFIYLSDPFIRNLIGAEKKLTQRDRLVCRSRLQMLDHAQLLFRTQFGKDAQSIDELSQHGCLGSGDKPIQLLCPGNGKYHISPDGIQSFCSYHGNKESMIPCCENPVERVSDKQAAEYKQFVENYSRYWQTFFDPIAVRIQLQPKKTRVETIVLPLINNTIYMGLAAGLGGQPEPLDSLPVPERNIFSLAFKLDKDRLLEQMGIPDPQPESEQEQQRDRRPKFLAAEVEQSLMQLGLALHNHHSAYKLLPPRQIDGAKSGLSWRVHVLPFMEEQALYEQFKLDEPWDSEHNRELIPQIPSLFAAASAELANEGKTRFVFPQHPDAMYRGAEQGGKFRDVLDGLSNTIMVVVADEDQAVVWTKPDDLSIDLEKPRQGWSQGVDDVVSALMADGAVVRLAADFPEQIVGHLLTRGGKEALERELPRSPTRFRSRRRSPLQLVQELGLAEFLHRGIGNQVGVHVCDGDPLVDLNVSRFVGMLTGTMGRGRGSFSMQTGMFGVLALAFNSPVYVSIPVQDPAIVDRTLENLDLFLARVARNPADQMGGFLSIEQDFYQHQGNSDPTVRAYAFRFGPITWRFYWTRIDGGIYIASKPYLIEDLKAAAAQPGSGNEEPDVGHGMVRVRPENWNQVKPHFRIGWAESERRTCLDQLGTLAHATRALRSETGDEVERTLVSSGTRLARQVFQRGFNCPCHGNYSTDVDGKTIRCSVHGTVGQPRQLFQGKLGRIAEFAESLRDVRMDLTFLEDGLHAVVTLETK